VSLAIECVLIDCIDLQRISEFGGRRSTLNTSGRGPPGVTSWSTHWVRQGLG
jgi:hypothetical protein